MSPRRPDRFRVAVALLAALAGVVVLWVALDLFPHHSSNHDEAVYLQQARLLLDGRLWFETPVPAAFHHWFFVVDGGRVYPKYQPAVAALFAPGVAVGEPRLVLAAVAAANVALVAALTAAAFDRPTGLAAGGLLAATPQFVLTSAVFLPYAPVTALNLLFAYGYVRAHRGGGRRAAALAGVGVAAAFFARPYTAVLFAAPFVVHACWRLWRARAGRAALRRALGRYGVVAALGAASVGATLAYNAVVTGDPLLFPYEAFAPADGLGFGHREILGYDREYTPALALRANALVLADLVTQWSFAPPLGVGLAVVGVAASARGALARRAAARDVTLVPDDVTPAVGRAEDASRFAPGGGSSGGRGADPEARVDGTLSDDGLRLLLVGVAASVVAGNVYFWGNLNVLGDLADPADGLISQFGPFYHFDLLLPLSAFGAAGLAWVVRRAHALLVGRVGVRDRRAWAVVAALLLFSTPAVVAAEAGALGPPVAENRQYSQRYESAYEPFEGRSFSNDLVFVATPYGPWLGHPFQSLLNDGDLDGSVVYALDRSPATTFAVLDAYPGRTPYRYTFRGRWAPTPTGRVTAALVPLDVRDGRAHRVETTVGVLGEPSSVRLSADGRAVTADLSVDGKRTTVPWVVEPGRVRLAGGADNLTVPYDGSAQVALAVTFVQDGGATVTYRQELSVQERGDRVRVVWPPKTAVCRLRPDCGHGGTVLPGRGPTLSGASVNTTVETA